MSQFFTAIVVLFVSVSSFASAFPGAVWCKVDGKAQNAIVQDESSPCAGALMMGDACYTGSRTYTFVDGPNEGSSKESMDPAAPAISSANSLIFVFIAG